jgi:signal transduction histidine kinase
MYTVAERCSRRLSAFVLATAFVGAWVATEIAFEAHPEQDHNAVHAGAVLIGWVIGDTVRARRAYQTDLAARQRRESEEQARRAITEERLRLSREVHDVVSHSLSVIAVQAGVGRMLFDEQPDQARAALAEVETRSRSALEELRRLLAVVRQPEPGEPALSPAPGLDDLPSLVERLAASGLDVTLDIGNRGTPLSPMLELSAYRIVQEALTNVIKHAAAAPARVTIRERSDALTIEVVDTGAASASTPSPSPGWGLVGMRERAAYFGGSVTAAPGPEGGFRVSASLPTSGHADGER